MWGSSDHGGDSLEEPRGRTVTLLPEGTSLSDDGQARHRFSFQIAFATPETAQWSIETIVSEKNIEDDIKADERM